MQFSGNHFDKTRASQSNSSKILSNQQSAAKIAACIISRFNILQNRRPWKINYLCINRSKTWSLWHTCKGLSSGAEWTINFNSLFSTSKITINHQSIVAKSNENIIVLCCALGFSGFSALIVLNCLLCCYSALDLQLPLLPFRPLVFDLWLCSFAFDL